MTGSVGTPPRFLSALPALILVGLAVILAGCARTTQLGPVITESQSVDQGAAKSVGIDIALGAGELKLGPGGGKLLDIQVMRNTGLLKPEVTYSVAGDRGTLSLRQPSQTNTLGRVPGSQTYRYNCDLRVSPHVPLDVNIQVGAGKVDLSLVGLDVDTLKVSYGAAAGRVDLSGDRTHNVDVSIKGGVGSATIRLPSRVGARVEVEGGLGTVDAYRFRHIDNAYVNDAYGTSPITVMVHLEAGIGAVNLELEPPGGV